MLVPVLIVLFILVASLLALADWIARGLLRPRRRPLTRTPRDYGLEYDEVAFRSTDGLTLRGWWMPAEAGAGPAPAVVLLHPLFGNRQGSAAAPEIVRAAGPRIIGRSVVEGIEWLGPSHRGRHLPGCG